jgi:hypothetical protein
MKKMRDENNARSESFSCRPAELSLVHFFQSRRNHGRHLIAFLSHFFVRV